MIDLKENDISNALGPLRQMKAWYDNIKIPPEEHPCAANWNEVGQTEIHYKKLIVVQRHKCVGTYFMRRRKRPNGE